jgi:hypothetical protein
MVMFVFNPPNDELRKIPVLRRLHVAYIFMKTGVSVERGDQCIWSHFGMHYLKDIGSIGPTGTKGFNHVTNKGKTNPRGHLVTTTDIACVNPVKTPACLLGVIIIFRFLVLGEPFPDFLDHKDFAQRPMLRCPQSYRKSETPKSVQKPFRCFFNACGVHSFHTIHFNRKDGQEGLDQDGVHPDLISRHGKYSEGGGAGGTTKRERESYLNGQPYLAVLNRSGGEWTNPKSYSNAWENVHVKDELMKLVVPPMLEQREKIKIEQAKYPSFKEQKKRRLFMGLFSLECHIEHVRMALRLFASRPIDVNTGKFQTIIAMDHLQWATHKSNIVLSWLTTGRVKRDAAPLWLMWSQQGYQEGLFQIKTADGSNRLLFQTDEFGDLVHTQGQAQFFQEDDRFTIPAHIEVKLGESLIPMCKAIKNMAAAVQDGESAQEQRNDFFSDWFGKINLRLQVSEMLQSFNHTMTLKP